MVQEQWYSHSVWYNFKLFNFYLLPSKSQEIILFDRALHERMSYLWTKWDWLVKWQKRTKRKCKLRPERALVSMDFSWKEQGNFTRSVFPKDQVNWFWWDLNIMSSYLPPKGASIRLLLCFEIRIRDLELAKCMCLCVRVCVCVTPSSWGGTPKRRLQWLYHIAITILTLDASLDLLNVWEAPGGASTRNI